MAKGTEADKSLLKFQCGVSLVEVFEGMKPDITCTFALGGGGVVRGIAHHALKLGGLHGPDLCGFEAMAGLHRNFESLMSLAPASSGTLEP